MKELAWCKAYACMINKMYIFIYMQAMSKYLCSERHASKLVGKVVILAVLYILTAFYTIGQNLIKLTIQTCIVNMSFS